tara:strand:+ start:105 stop:281 length:177 start_codon:yes stop_codon:yes gene_type:complete
MEKTYKREMAGILFIWLVYIVETKDAATISTAFWPIITFIGLAFGLDVYGKLLQSKPS